MNLHPVPVLHDAYEVIACTEPVVDEGEAEQQGRQPGRPSQRQPPQKLMHERRVARGPDSSLRQAVSQIPGCVRGGGGRRQAGESGGSVGWAGGFGLVR